jgi:ligand-binding sensor domain-containing protein
MSLDTFKKVIYELLAFNNYSLLFLLFMINTMQSQNLISDYTYFSINDGLLDNSILDVSKDEHDIIWVATKRGLSRFDGVNFINFNSNNSSVFFKNNKIDKLYSNGHILYLLSRREGLIQLNTTTMKFKRISYNGIESIDISGNTTVMLFTKGQLVVKKRGKIKAKHNLTTTLNAEVIVKNNKIYCSVQGKKLQVYNLQLNELEQISLPYKINSTSIIKSKKYGLIYNPNDSVYAINKKDQYKVHPEMQDFDNVKYYREDIKGKPLFIKNNLPHYFIKDKLIVKYFDNDQNIEMRLILRLNDNSFILGTNQGLILLGYHKETSHIISDYKPKSNNEVRVRRKILEDKNGDLYFLGYPGLVQLKNGKPDLVNTTPISSYDGLIRDDTIYFTTEGSGFYSYSIQTKKIEKNITDDLKRNDYSIHISVYKDDILLIAGKRGIILYDTSNQKSRAYSLGDNIIVYEVVYNKAQKLYYAATNQGLIVFSLDYLNGIQKKNTIAKHDITTKDILLLPDKGQIWLATNQGLFIRDLNTLQLLKSYKTKNNITDVTVAGMVRVNNKVWVSTFYGITIYDLLNDSIKKITQTTGIKNIEFNYKSFCLRNNGNIIFGGLNAFEEFDSQTAISEKSISDFKISAVQKVKQSNEKWCNYLKENQKQIDFKTGIEELKIYLSNKDFANIDSYKFVYSINNQKDIEVQKNIIHVSSLSYGNHLLTIKMYDKVGVKISQKSIQLSATVPFYKKASFFKLILVILIITGFYAITYYRRSLHIESQTKNQIAMDLHDEVGSLLTGLLMHTESTKTHNIDHYKMKTGLKRALFSLGNYIYAYNRPKISLKNLEYEIREFLFQDIDQTKINLNINVKEYQDVLISFNLYRDVKLCIFEAVNNSTKHSNCSTLNIDFCLEYKTLIITVEDNGILESTENLKMTGSGIKNLKERTRRNNGKAEFSVPSKHTGLIIKFTFFLK